MAFPGCDVNDMPALLRHLLARIGELTRFHRILLVKLLIFSIARGGFDSETLEELEFWVEFLEFDMASFAANNRKDQWMEEWEAMPQEKVALIDMCKKLSDKVSFARL